MTEWDPGLAGAYLEYLERLERLSDDGEVPVSLALSYAITDNCMPDPRFDRLLERCGVHTWHAVLGVWRNACGVWFEVLGDGSAVIVTPETGRPGICLSCDGPAGGVLDFIVFDPRRPADWFHLVGGAGLLGRVAGRRPREVLEVVETPLEWLRTAAGGLCVLNGATAAAQLAECDVRLLVKNRDAALELIDRLGPAVAAERIVYRKPRI